MSVRSRLKTIAAEKAEALVGAAARKFEDISMRAGYKLDSVRERIGQHVPAPPAHKVDIDLERSLSEVGRALLIHATSTREDEPANRLYVRREARELREESRHFGVRPAGLVHNMEELGLANDMANSRLGQAAEVVFTEMGNRMEARKDAYANKPGVTPPLNQARLFFADLSDIAKKDGFTGTIEALQQFKKDPALQHETGVSAQQLEVARRSLLQMAQGKMTIDQVTNAVDLATDKKMFGHEDFARQTIGIQNELAGSRDGQRVTELRDELKAIRQATPYKTRLANLPKDEAYSGAAKVVLSQVFTLPPSGTDMQATDNRNLALLATLVHPDSEYTLSGIRDVLQQGAKRNGIGGGLRKISEAEKFGMTPAFCASASTAVNNILTGELPAQEAHSTLLKAARSEADGLEGRPSSSPKSSWAKPLALTGLAVTVGALAWYGSRDKPVSDPVAQQAVPTAPAASAANWGNRVMDTVKSWMPGKKAEAPVIAPPDKTWDIHIPDEPKASAPASGKRQFNSGAASGASAPAAAAPTQAPRPVPGAKATMV